MVNGRWKTSLCEARLIEERQVEEKKIELFLPFWEQTHSTLVQYNNIWKDNLSSDLDTKTGCLRRKDLFDYGVKMKLICFAINKDLSFS